MIKEFTPEEIEDLQKSSVFYDLALKKGRQEGVQQGRREGQEATKEQMAKRMLSEGISLDIISKVTELPEEVIQKMKSSL